MKLGKLIGGALGSFRDTIPRWLKSGEWASSTPTSSTSMPEILDPAQEYSIDMMRARRADEGIEEIQPTGGEKQWMPSFQAMTVELPRKPQSTDTRMGDLDLSSGSRGTVGYGNVTPSPCA